MRQEKDEPVFSMQEQAVVYLFSRYWEEGLEEFKGKKVTRIHTHFPDFSIEDTKGNAEGIEFEYGLKAFRSHLNKGTTKLASECRASLKDEDIRVLYIIYWDRNDDESVIKKALRKSGIVSKFICLKDYFRAIVSRARGAKGDPLRTFWRFSNKPLEAAYPIRGIMDAADDLAKKGEITELPIDNERQMYRTLGWDKKGSDFIECDHWEKIHFFTTTTRMAHYAIPSRLFVKPNGHQHFIGYFDMKYAFKLKKPAGNGVRKFFRDYYFYEYDPYHNRSKCFVCTFKRMDYEHGKRLFAFLKNLKKRGYKKKSRYKLGVRGSLVIEKRDNAKINDIIRAR